MLFIDSIEINNDAGMKNRRWVRNMCLMDRCYYYPPFWRNIDKQRDTKRYLRFMFLPNLWIGSAKFNSGKYQVFTLTLYLKPLVIIQSGIFKDTLCMFINLESTLSLSSFQKWSSILIKKENDWDNIKRNFVINIAFKNKNDQNST